MKRLLIFLGMCVFFAMTAFAVPTAADVTDSEIQSPAILSAEKIVESGTCGDNLTWTLDSEGTLTISGEGEMWEWSYDTWLQSPFTQYKSKISSVVIENGVSNVGEYAFYYCTNIKSVTIPDSVKSVGEYSFVNCTNLTSIKIPDSVTYIGNCAFYGCTGLTNVTIGNGVTKIADYVFGFCESLTNIKFGNGITSIGYEAFSWCKSITSVVIPNGVTYIGGRAFYECTSLTNVVIPDSVTSIGNTPFGNCTSLSSITVDENNLYYLSDEMGVLFDKNKTSLIQYPPRQVASSYEIPDSVCDIENSSFSGCINLTSVTIPDSVRYIGEYAFQNCTSLTGSVSISGGVTSIGIRTFLGCTSLERIEVDKNNKYYSSDENGILYNKYKTVLLKYPGGNIGINYSVPENVILIREFAFSDCQNLESVEIHDKVEYYDAFVSCTSLKSVTILDGATSISKYAFVDCTSLTSVTIPDSVTSIGEYAFQNCTSLLSVELPNSVTRIGDLAFYGCASLEKITILSNTTIIGFRALQKSEKLTIYGYTDSYAETYANENNIPFISLGEIPPQTPGELNSDGVIDANDAILLLQYSMFPELYPLEYAGTVDFTGDGEVDMNDAILLLQHSMFPDLYPIE